jgi:hypothetical protein
MWDCCPYTTYNNCCRFPTPKHSPNASCGGGVGSNRSPSTKNTKGVIFYLEEQYEKKINIAEQKVKNAASSIQSNIDMYKKTIETLSARIQRLDNINCAVKMLNIEDEEY